jgi:thiol-disulfide isomerase/thioredoxin
LIRILSGVGGKVSFSGLMSLISLFVFASVNIGDRVPAFLEETQWIKGRAPVFENSVTILELWRSSCSNCREQIPHLTELQKAYNNRISIVAITSEPIDVTTQFLKEHGDEISYTLGHVSKETMAKLNQDVPGVPYCFIIDKNGVVIWKGHPRLLENVLESILDGSINAEIMKKIEPLENALNEISETNDLAAITQAAKNLLAVDPGNILALETVINIAKYNKDKVLIKEVFDRAPMSGLSATKADEIAGMLVYGSDQESNFPDTAIRYSEYSLSKEPKNSKYLNTYARVLFCRGELEKAVVNQKKAVKLDPGNNIYKNNLDFYLASQKGGK